MLPPQGNYIFINKCRLICVCQSNTLPIITHVQGFAAPNCCWSMSYASHECMRFIHGLNQTGSVWVHFW